MFAEILLSLIGATLLLCILSLLIGLSCAYDRTSPFYISKDGRHGYRKCFLERFIDACELYSKW